MKNICFVFLSFLFVAASCGRESAVSPRAAIIPRPVSLTIGEGAFALTGTTTVYCDPAAERTACFAAGFLRTATGYKLPIKAADNAEGLSDGIFFMLENSPETKNEAYSLDVTPDRILISASGKAGLFYGFQSLRQLLPEEIESRSVVKRVKWNVASVSIQDEPYYRWRGFMLDVSRTFHGADIVKKYLDIMALYKLNTFHLHLTDDQGWRIEIKKYPELISEKATVFPRHHNQPAERSGFYTQQEIRELVAYAAERNITIVPEIDVPGHCWPILLVHPELGVNGNLEPDYVMPFITSWSYWGTQFTPNALDPTNEQVYTFLDNVFTEVAELFPGEYIHFGGDEVKHHLWEDEPHVQDFMRARGFRGFSDLQSYFVNRVADIIIAKGKKPIGWSDVLKGAETLDHSVAVMSWLSDLQNAVSNRFYTVAAPSGCLYLDLPQVSPEDGTMADFAGAPNTIGNIYAYDPSESLNEDEQQYILGVQANMWTHIALNVKDMNVQLFPRLLALAEICWLPKQQRDYEDFQTRLNSHYPRLAEMGLDYYRPGGYVSGSWSPNDLTEEFRPIEWNVTDKVYADGRIIAGFFYQRGESFMKIRKVELLENGKIISTDDHSGLADDTRATSLPKTYLYHLSVDNYNPRSAYTLRAEVAGDTNRDSYGNFTFNLSPYKPFITER